MFPSSLRALGVSEVRGFIPCCLKFLLLYKTPSSQKVLGSLVRDVCRQTIYYIRIYPKENDKI